MNEFRYGASCERDEYGVTRLSIPFTLRCGSHEHNTQWDEDDFRKECQYGTVKVIGCYSRYRQLILPSASVTENYITYRCVQTPRGLAIATDVAMPSSAMVKR